MDRVFSRLNSAQNNFVRRRSSFTSLTCVSQFIADTLDASDQVDIIYTVFSKDFDSNDHNILLRKLGAFGLFFALISLLTSIGPWLFIITSIMQQLLVEFWCALGF